MATTFLSRGSASCGKRVKFQMLLMKGNIRTMEMVLCTYHTKICHLKERTSRGTNKHGSVVQKVGSEENEGTYSVTKSG